MTPVRHTMILASAGSGKTYALTNRFVALLARGAAPERIIALTFTRKAAGEFFDEILNKLAAAASSDSDAARLAAAIGSPRRTRADFLAMLRSVVDAMPRLSLGTLDGFFARIVRSFPLELGLAGEFEILQEHFARRARRRVLRSLFTASGEPDKHQSDFIEAFKRATFGVEEKQLGRRLDRFLDENAEIFLEAPARAWGDPRRIWPGGSPWFDAPAVTRAEAETRLRNALPWETLSLPQRQRFDDFFEEWKRWRAGAPLERPMAYLVENAFKIWDDLQAGRGSLTVERKKVNLSPAASRALHAVVVAIVREEIERRLEMTRGLYGVLSGYERIYHDSVRRGGSLTFADVQRLLLPAAGGPVLRAGVSDESREEDPRLAIDWRLDAQFDHWLLDEFQDTSFGQWSVLRNLIDEAVQDPEGRRSFFYVGDVKQAIFSWREGDPRLFREIFNHYNAAQAGAIEEVQLNQSWRSGPAVIDLVNRVFGDARALAAVLPRTAAEAWACEWRDHTSAHPAMDGFAAILPAGDKAARFAETLRTLQEIEPLERGLTAAVLVQKNETAAELANFLRTVGGLRAVAETDLAVCTDNPLGAALLALVRAAAFPGDSLAWQHVRMTPLDAALAARGIRSPDELTAHLLEAIHQRGFAGAIEGWSAELVMSLDSADEFSRGRARQWLEAAHLFDQTGSRDVAEFLEFAERHTRRDDESAAVVRVMTIHKSKGLGFDVVILPDLEGRSLAQRRRGLAVKKAADRSVEWILDLPPQAFAERDPVLSAYLSAAEGDAAYESLCLLYVAMTRAKRAMYLITEPVGDSVARTFPRILQGAVGETYAEGNPRWFAGIAPPSRPAARSEFLEPWQPAESSAGMRRVRLTARPPSGPEGASLPAPALFGLDSRARADFGTAVHALLAEVRWSDEPWEDRVMAVRLAEDIATAARAEAMACLRAPALSLAFARPTGVDRAEVWRERAFEIVMDDAWTTGVFDRVVVGRDAKGRATSVHVWDFKTDRVASEKDILNIARRYVRQLEIYRNAAARLTGLAPGQVSATLVFTAIRERVGLAELATIVRK